MFKNTFELVRTPSVLLFGSLIAFFLVIPNFLVDAQCVYEVRFYLVPENCKFQLNKDTSASVITFYTTLVSCAPDFCVQNCDIGKPGFTNIHIVPHSHADMDWLLTTDQYYYRSRPSSLPEILSSHHPVVNFTFYLNEFFYTPAGVQYIIDTLVDALRRDPARRFMFNEMGHFYRWWRQQGDARKQLVRQLVNEGVFECISRGRHC